MLFNLHLQVYFRGIAEKRRLSYDLCHMCIQLTADRREHQLVTLDVCFGFALLHQLYLLLGISMLQFPYSNHLHETTLHWLT